MASKDELACVYSALILQDDDIAITPEKINTILKASKVEVESYWPALFAKALESIDVKSLVTNLGSAVSVDSSPAIAPTFDPVPAAVEKKEEKKKEEPKEESDDDMGFGLFD